VTSQLLEHLPPLFHSSFRQCGPDAVEFKDGSKARKVAGRWQSESTEGSIALVFVGYMETPFELQLCIAQMNSIDTLRELLMAVVISLMTTNLRTCKHNNRRFFRVVLGSKEIYFEDSGHAGRGCILKACPITKGTKWKECDRQSMQIFHALVGTFDLAELFYYTQLMECLKVM